MPKAVGVYKAKNGTWYFKAQGTNIDPDTGRWKQVTRRGFATAADAQLARKRYLDELASKRELFDNPTVEAGRLTVAQLIDRCLDEAEALKRLGPKTLYDYRSNVDAYIRPRIGHILAHELTVEDVNQWQVELARNGASQRKTRRLSPNTVRLARAPLNRAYKYAVAHGLVNTNPVAAVQPPPKTRSKPAYWTPDQARTFLAWQEGDRLYPLWAFLLSSGLRIGELVWLRWTKVDLSKRVARIDEFATTLGYDVEPSDGKSRDATRTIQLDAHLVGVLRHQAKLQADEHRTGGHPASGYVFTRLDGDYYHPQALSKLLGRTSTDAGLPRLTAHGLRHTCATLMLANGVPPKVAAERLGHADPTLFTNLYSHVTPTMQQDAADQLGHALFGDHPQTNPDSGDNDE